MLAKNLDLTGAIALCVTALLGAADPTSVIDAAMNGNRDAVKYAAAKRRRREHRTRRWHDRAALCGAKNDAELAKMLLVAGANVKATTRLGAIRRSCLPPQRKCSRCCDVLLDGGGRIPTGHRERHNPLMLAAAAGKVDAVKLLVDKGAT